EGNVVASFNRDMVLNQYNPIVEAEKDERHRSTANLFQKILEERTGVSQYINEGESLYAAYNPIGRTNWILIMAANRDEVLSEIPALQKIIIALTIAILLIGIIITYIIGNSIINPILRTVIHAKEIANLELRREVPEH